MKVICLDGLTGISLDSEELPTGVLAICRTDQYLQELHESDRRYIASAKLARQRTFSSGRRSARVALDGMAISIWHLRTCDGLPQWPEGVVGNITHTDELSATVVAETDSVLGVGIDLQKVGSASEKVAQRVLLPEEKEWVSQGRGYEWSTVFFSAKEAAYKAVNPVVGESLGFQDVQLRIDEETASFVVSTVAHCPSSPILARGRGYLHCFEGHWLSLFVIPADAPND